ncbi:T-complex protein 1, delta subunit [Ancylostoma caninum]|uniref:T-complex protein 1 subunit delta n=1 Tax=Ancylostoma caninum TaxID=29170 RepID=A0A368GCL3_ANCCA|nr:T-complex protein 1, delta subunit [Ancylostoma caninum]
MSARPAAAPKASGKESSFRDKDKPESVRNSNIVAAKAVADAVRTSLGPRGMDKMIQSGNGDVTITNDGATILNQMSVVHPTAKMLVELSKAQDIEAGDGTTTVVVIAGALLDAAQTLLQKGIHPTTISDSFQAAATEAEKILVEMSSPVDLSNDELLVKMATTSLNSKVVSQHSWLLAPMAVNAVKRIIDPARDTSVNLKMIKIIKKMGDTVEESEMIDGALIDQKTMGRGGPTRVEKAKIGLIQFQLSPPKTDILGCRPVASVDHFVPEALGSADLVEEISCGGDGKVIKVTGVANPGQACSILLRGSNKLVLEEAERSLHDALCVIRCLVKNKALVPGGGAPEMEVAVQLRQLAQKQIGAQQYCWRAFADALELVPYTLAENAGLSPIHTVTELRAQHANGNTDYGVNGYVTDIREENVLQPLLVTLSAIKQASECVRSILKIDDISLCGCLNIIEMLSISTALIKAESS